MRSVLFVSLIALTLTACSGASQPFTPSSPPKETITSSPLSSPVPSTSPAPDFSRLQVVGNKIVNEEGEIVVLRGLGVAEMIYLATGSYDVLWNEELFRTVHDWGATAVRIPVAPVRFFQDEERGLELLDQAIEWAGKYEMYVIINFNIFGFPPTGFLADSTSLGVVSNVDTIRFWQTVSSRYAGNDVVAFYEIINEAASHPWDGRTYSEDWLILKDFYELVIDLIRENDPETIILAGGLKWAADLSYVPQSPIQRSNVAYDLHLNPSTADDWDLAYSDVAERYPIILGEAFFGIDVTGEQSWMNESSYAGELPFRFALMDFIEEHGLSWFGVVFSTQWVPELVQNEFFEPTEVGQFFHDQLSSYNRKSTTGERIHTDPDVFAGAVGRWESIDPSDRSQRTLAISSVGNHRYNVRYIDESVPLCNGNRPSTTLASAEAQGEREAFYQKIDIGPLYLDCSNGWVGGLIFDSLVYDSELDTLTDIQGTIWSRSDIDETSSAEVEFAGAVGEWMSIESSDGSNQTLTIEQLTPGTFKVKYVDEKASICGLDTNGSPLYAAEGNSQGEPFGRTLNLSLDFVCIGDPDGTTARFSIRFSYDPSTDVITDSFSNQWSIAD